MDKIKQQGVCTKVVEITKFAYKRCVVAFMDILGSKDLLFKDGEKSIDFLTHINGFNEQTMESFSLFNIKTFSDNVLIYSDDCSKENILSMIRAIALFQYDVLCSHGLMIRGGLSVGNLYAGNLGNNAGNYVVGPALVNSYHLESKKAIYSRILLDESVKQIIGDDNIEVICSKGTSFIDYLTTTVTEGFADTDRVMVHAKALMMYIMQNCNSNGYDSMSEWDKIRTKDVWALAYHNRFCEEYEISTINFKEVYNKEKDKIVIEITGR